MPIDDGGIGEYVQGRWRAQGGFVVLKADLFRARISSNYCLKHKRKTVYMPSYRFCRPDDLQLIVTAVNACYLLHYPDAEALTEEHFKEHMTLFAVRPGNCMVALERQQPVGVVISARRDTQAWIQAIGCQPAFQRRGIASQLIEALIRKIAIQRTSEITVDVPEDNLPAVKFFERVAFNVHGCYVSYHGTLTKQHASPEAVTRATIGELLAAYAQFHPRPMCWERQAESLAAYGEVPQAYAYRPQGELWGYLVHRGSTILDLAIAPHADADQVSTTLLSAMAAAGITQASIAKVPREDGLCAVLERRGFTQSGGHLLMGQQL